MDTPTIKNIQYGKHLIMKDAISFYYSVEMHKFMSPPIFSLDSKKQHINPVIFPQLTADEPQC